VEQLGSELAHWNRCGVQCSCVFNGKWCAMENIQTSAQSFWRLWAGLSTFTHKHTHTYP